MKTKVVFRKDKKTKDVIAFLPEIEVNFGNIMSYQHIGQHGEASYLYYLTDTIKATEDEYSDLFQELNSIYENSLIVKQKINRKDLCWN